MKFLTLSLTKTKNKKQKKNEKERGAKTYPTSETSILKLLKSYH